MLGQRLQLWRLSNFALERLEAPRGIYLLRGRARANPKDERLFALAEVRDLTPIRDVTGRIVELPALEHTALEALAAIRRHLAPLPVAERPLADLLSRVRLLCTSYDPKSGRYRFDYSLILEIAIGLSCALLVLGFVLRSWRQGQPGPRPRS